MKIYAFNGSPRKTRNTAQMLKSFIEGVRSVAPEADIEYIDLYDYDNKGCMACFTCQRKENRDRLRCHIKDDLYEIIDGAFHADGLVFGSPIYFFDITSQLRAFLERLMYPGDSDKTIPTAMIYTMNAPQAAMEKMNFEGALSTSKRFLESTFRMAPECVYAFDTYQYNENDAFIDGFTQWAPRKKERHDQVFADDLRKAFEAGARMAQKIIDLQKGE